MTRFEAIKMVHDNLTDELLIHANGMICRESYSICDRPENFYMLGSMGLASSIGLGVAVNRPNKKVIILDGDGNVLMNMGGLAMIGERSPKNLLHIVLDNRSYESTGGQRTISPGVDFLGAASACGYSFFMSAKNQKEVEEGMKRFSSEDGPGLIWIQISRESGNHKIGRVVQTPDEIADRFKNMAISGEPNEK